MKRFVLDYLDKACQTADQITDCRFDSSTADAVLHMKSGRTVHVYVINRAIRIPEIIETCQQNTTKRIHTLFIIDGRMIPDDNSEVDPPHWMLALHALAHGRIYAYWCDQRRCSIRPVHMEWRWGDEPRRFTHGPAVDIGRLRTDRIELTSKYITGNFAIADFSDGQFWKKQDPNAGQEHKYSWREWSFGGQKRPKEEPQPEPEPFDPWEAFRQNYGEPAGSTDAGWQARRRDRQRQERQQRQQRQGYTGSTRRSAYTTEMRNYTLLGVPTTASYDEVKQAYRRMAREYHPDLHPDQKEQYTAKMADINAAFDAIRKKLE